MNTSFLKNTSTIQFTKPINTTKNPRVAILTSKKSQEYINTEDQRITNHYIGDDILLNETFKQNNMIYEEVIWDDKNINWTDYDAVLIRSTWDYHEGKLNTFLNTLTKIEKLGVLLFNSLETIKWNSIKTYLKDLALAGIPVIDTMYATRSEMPDLEAELNKKGWTECILKPVVSASAYKTYKASNSKEAQEIFTSSYDKDEMVMIQPFASEIINDGEWSFIFLDGKYSHSVLKKPRSGDFRVQIFLDNPEKAEDWMIADASHILKTVEHFINETPLYVRIDTIRRNGKLYVMEIELIEPYLFLQDYPESAQKLAGPLKQKIEENKRAQLTI